MRSTFLLTLLFSSFIVQAADDKPHPGLRKPELATEKAPETFRVKFATTKGDFTVKITRAWSPLGVDRFYNLIKVGYFNDVGLYRVARNFVVQFGFHGEPAVSQAWAKAEIKDDPPSKSNTKGRLVFANRGRNTRTTQLFINLRDNTNLDPMGFTPFGEVESEEGMAVIDTFYAGYGEGPPYGRGPDQRLLERQGNAYLKKSYPELDYIKSITVID